VHYVAAYPGIVIEIEWKLGLLYVHIEVPFNTESQALSRDDALGCRGSTQGERESCGEFHTLSPSQRSVDGSCEYMLLLQDSLQKDDPCGKGQTQTNMLTTGRRGPVVSTCEGIMINNKDDNMNNFNFDMVFGNSRDSASNSRGNSMVKVPCSDDTPLASNNTGSYYSEPSHLDSNDSIGTSPKPLGKVVRL